MNDIEKQPTYDSMYEDISIEEVQEQLSQTVLDELGFNDLDLDGLKKESLESKYVGENPEGIY